MKSNFGPSWTWRLQVPPKRRWLYTCLHGIIARRCEMSWMWVCRGLHSEHLLVLLIVGLCFYLHCHIQIPKTPIQERVSLGIELLLLSFFLTWFCFWHHFVTCSVFRHFEVCFQMSVSQFHSQNFECNLIVYFLLCPTYTIWCSFSHKQYLSETCGLLNGNTVILSDPTEWVSPYPSTQGWEQAWFFNVWPWTRSNTYSLKCYNTQLHNLIIWPHLITSRFLRACGSATEVNSRGETGHPFYLLPLPAIFCSLCMVHVLTDKDKKGLCRQPASQWIRITTWSNTLSYCRLVAT